MKRNYCQTESGSNGTNQNAQENSAIPDTSSSEDKQISAPNDPSNDFRVLNKDVVREIASHSSVNHIVNLMSVSKTTYHLFRPSLIPFLAMKALTCVVQGNPDGLAHIAKHKPEALFEKGRVIDLRGRIFYSISAYQLTIFLCDENMKKTIDPFIPEELREKRQEQYAELGSGGADLIKLDVDPLKAAEKDFNSILTFKTTYILSDDEQQEVTFPLFENKNAIIYYQDKESNVNFYYASRETKAIKKLSVCANTEEDREAFEAFKLSFAEMENNSSRRSSNTEHQLIETMLQCKLHRDGIEYEQDGIRYRDSRTSFRLINAYRTCIRLYSMKSLSTSIDAWKTAENYWCTVVGKAQGEEMWLLQRICEEGRPFYPLPASFDNFKRGVKVYNLGTERNEDLLLDGKLVDGFGLKFAICKTGEKTAFEGCNPSSVGAGSKDLIALCWLVGRAKANVIECEQEQDLQPQSSYNAQ